MKKSHSPKESSPNTLKSNSTKKTLGKLDSMLFRFAKGKQYHRFTAEIIGDHCLHTTVSDLRKRHGIAFSRRWIKIPNRFGSISKVKLYWLEGQNLKKAKELSGLQEVAE